MAENVRDFAWASSRKFMWGANEYEQKDAAQPFVMAMSFYPNDPACRTGKKLDLTGPVFAWEACA